MYLHSKMMVTQSYSPRPRKRVNFPRHLSYINFLNIFLILDIDINDFFSIHHFGFSIIICVKNHKILLKVIRNLTPKLDFLS